MDRRKAWRPTAAGAAREPQSSDLGQIEPLASAKPHTAQGDAADNSEQPKSWRDFLPVHPAAELFPLMAGAELRELGENIKARGGLIQVGTDAKELFGTLSNRVPPFYDGKVFAGSIIRKDGRFIARGPNGRVLGRFTSLRTAVRAIPAGHEFSP
jgi:hypothetical protein